MDWLVIPKNNQGFLQRMDLTSENEVWFSKKARMASHYGITNFTI
jgi:hypothetical protein